MRLIILTCHRRSLASRALAALARSPGCEVVKVVLSQTPKVSSARTRQRKLRKVLKIGLAGAINGVRMRAWYAEDSAPDIEFLCRELGIPFVETPSVSGAKTRREFTGASADLGLSLGNSYIPERVYSLPRLGTINFHGELLPKYQNAQSVIWPIYYGESKTGFTIHKVDRGIDTGAIIYRQEVNIDFHPTLRQTVIATNRKVREQAVAGLTSVCQNFESLNETAESQAKGVSYTTPSIWQFLRMWRNNRRLYRRARAEALASGSAVQTAAL